MQVNLTYVNDKKYLICGKTDINVISTLAIFLNYTYFEYMLTKSFIT